MPDLNLFLESNAIVVISLAVVIGVVAIIDLIDYLFVMKKPVPVVGPSYDEPCFYCYPECTCHEPPLVELVLEPRPCGGTEPHFDDLADKLDQVLDVGQVYETIATCDGIKCAAESGRYWLAWIWSYASDKCCGINELVAFSKKPPKQFVFTLNGKITEVHGDGLRNAG